MSVEKFIGAYIPLNNQHTKAFIATVSKSLGVSANTPLIMNKSNMKAIVIAMTMKGNGKNYISDNLFEQAYMMAQ